MKNMSENARMLAIWRLCNKDEVKIKMVEDFYDSLSDDMKENFNLSLMDYEEILNRNKYGPGQYRKKDLISMDAIRLSVRLRNDLKLFCFPFIEKVFVRSYQSFGCWRWAMSNLSKTRGDVGSCAPVRECLKKSVDLDCFSPHYNSIEVDTKKKS